MNELELSYQGSGTLYAIIRRQSDSYVWNGSAFAAWSDGSIASYDIPLTNRGGDLYQADFPASIIAGNYRIFYYEQASGSPAITDLVLKSPARYWDGAALGSESSISLSSYALTTLESAKRHLRITDTDDDTLLTEQINQVSLEIERICGIEFKARDRRERLNGVRQKTLTLKQWPILSVTRMAYGAGLAMTVQYSGVAVRADVGVSSTGIRLVSVATNGTATASNLLFSDYPSVSALATAINLLTGWTATVTTDQPSADLNPLGGSNAKSRAVTLTYPDSADFGYHVDFETGMVELSGWNYGWFGESPASGARTFPQGFKYLLIEYRAGFEAIPADVSKIANALVQDAFYGGMMAKNVKSGSIGPYSWTASQEQASAIRDQLAYYIDISKTIGSAR